MPTSAELPRQIGAEVAWPGENSYTIASLVGKAGNIQIVEGTGRYHVYWHKELLVNGRITQELIHHGGRIGFPDLNAVKRQHERVILRYTGITVDLPADQMENGVVPEQNFPQIAKQLQVEIPGEQQLVGSWVETLQDVSRDLPQVTNHGKLSLIREELNNLLAGNLSRSVNRHKVNAARTLETGLRGSRGELLLSVNRAQLELLIRAQQTVAITLGVMQRYNDLERLQIYYNGLVDQLPANCANAIRVLRGGIPADRIQRVMNLNFVDPKQSIQTKLLELKGEPYFSKAKQFLHDLAPVRTLWENRQLEPLGYQEIVNILTKQTQELEIWRRRIHEEYEGVNFGKYNLGAD